ncbi:hypothetical protein A2799_01770 [Candidatus Roizmanbacteria bacterium RIFCSPHIGHO2_01_FULL_39_24]|uniref:Uncharacterized protein n=1 Tax=Candidatus Roizmanbacteria bacterium RIFCSPHIGHO2_01_FULL_39_24 TaxID=1802032 RepID=A0A1F7GFS0_9BACT|nr:MAG: hypothetical protein A2799_01770 [Candidatus Roizmanbacteria bacterium RIFCSPHIGHO2_01_FULL_39_24]
MINLPIKKQTAADLIARVRREVENAIPSNKTMLEDIKMMNIRLHSISGDIFSIKDDQSSFIHSLWKATKIDQITHEAVEHLDDSEIDDYFAYLDTIQPHIHADSDERGRGMRILKLAISKKEEYEA